MTNIYYSQCGEDKVISKLFSNKKNGVYIELGAMDGNLYSNTKYFEDTLGWSGILIEPNPYTFKYLQQNRPNNFLFNNLVSNNTEELEYKYFEGGISAVSGIVDTLPEEHNIKYFNNENYKNIKQDIMKIKPRTLTDIVKSTGIKHIDFLSLDVEGHEYEVLLSWNFNIQINLIMIETLTDNEEKNQLCRNLLQEKNYKKVMKYRHNEIYILNSIKL